MNIKGQFETTLIIKVNVKKVNNINNLDDINNNKNY